MEKTIFLTSQKDVCLLFFLEIFGYITKRKIFKKTYMNNPTVAHCIVEIYSIMIGNTVTTLKHRLLKALITRVIFYVYEILYERRVQNCRVAFPTKASRRCPPIGRYTSSKTSLICRNSDFTVSLPISDRYLIIRLTVAESDFWIIQTKSISDVYREFPRCIIVPVYTDIFGFITNSILQFISKFH